MNDKRKTKQQLIAENENLRQRVAALEGDALELRLVKTELARNKAVMAAVIQDLPLDYFILNRDGRCILQNALSRQR